jgi:hypothetical protein
MRYPMMSGPPGHPMTADPLVAAADPIPVAPDPYITRGRRNTNDLDSRRRRRHHHHAARIVTLIGDDHTPGQRHADEEAESHSRVYPLALVHDRYHMILGTIKTQRLSSHAVDLRLMAREHTAVVYGVPPVRGLDLSLRRRVSRG